MKYVLIFILVIPAFWAKSQNDTLPMPANLYATYVHGTHSPDGQVGRNYWQNKANYDINVQFDPKTRLIQGSEDIVFTNNSPDTLNHIVFKLFPNFFKKGSPRDRLIADEDATEGVSIQKMSINDEPQDIKNIRITGTNMDVGVQPLLPKQSVRFSIHFSYILNKGSHNRTGEVEEGAYFVAYFFPRITVYDDIDGWNMNPYIGSQQFYNDFCDFKTKITVPKDYLVWATGDLQNCQEVLTPKYCERLAIAEKTDAVTTIIDTLDLGTQITTDNPTNTWLFEAKNVTDFVFATSNHYIWKSSSLVVDKTTGRRTRVDATFNPKHKNYFPVIDYARKTVDIMSYQFPKWAFPYNHITIFNGLSEMEYPMMVNDIPVENTAECIELTDHEIFHTMFPFYMGINETKYGWMDEGWATLGEWLISPIIDPTIVNEFGMKEYEELVGTEQDVSLMALSTHISGPAFFANSYPKPALGYLYIKDMLGDDLFFKALHHYIKTWHGKHPMPYDFFNCMNTGAGKNMNWFWKCWFFDNGVPDLAIAKYASEGKQKSITIELKGTKPVPIDLTIYYTDGSSDKIHRSIEVWEKGNKTVLINLKTDKIVKKITLGGVYSADSNKTNNVWEMK